MTIEDTNALGEVIRANRFHFRSDGIRALAAMLEKRVNGFDRSRWFALIEGKPWQPKTGAPCSCRPGMERDNCPRCEGTGRVIDFAAIRAAKGTATKPEASTFVLPAYWASYLVNGDASGLPDGDREQADQFLTERGLVGLSCSCSEHQYFQWGNDANRLGGDVLEYTFLKPGGGQ